MRGAGYILTLINPAPTGAEGHWRMHAHRNLCLGPPGGKHLSGGSALASVVTLLEGETKRPLIQASAQFLASPPANSPFEIAVTHLQNGRSISQAVATLLIDGNEAAIITASLGSRPNVGDFVWAVAPTVPPPEVCPPVPFVRIDDGDLQSCLDIRLAGDPRMNPAGHAQFWIGYDGEGSAPAAFLTMIADYLPEAIHMNIGRRAGAVSLDNVIRIITRAATPWLLCDIALDAISNGLFHGRMAIYAQDGTLFATASQSGVVRLL
jgi:acyl-CoA thioesterase II